MNQPDKLMSNQSVPTNDALPAAEEPADHARWREELGLLVIYLLLFGALSWLGYPHFLKVRNLLSILTEISTIGMISVTATMVIISGGIDLSIGPIVALAGVVVAQLSQHVPMPVAILAALSAGAVIGAFNGAAVAFARINPFITTLATLSIVRGLAFIYSGNLTQSITNESFFFLGRGYVLGVPFLAIVMFILFALTAWVMGWTVFGRNIYAVGGNAQASRLAGLPVSSIRLAVYALSGLSAALAGVFTTSQLGAAAPQAAIGLELNVIAAVILGGTSLSGGKGSIWGTLLGVLIMGTLNNGMNIMQFSSPSQLVAQGIILLLAVGLDQLRQGWSGE